MKTVIHRHISSVVRYISNGPLNNGRFRQSGTFSLACRGVLHQTLITIFLSPLFSLHRFVASINSVHPFSKPPHFLKKPSLASHISTFQDSPQTMRWASTFDASRETSMRSQHRSSSSMVPFSEAIKMLSRRRGRGRRSAQGWCFKERWISVGWRFSGEDSHAVLSRGWAGPRALNGDNRSSLHMPLIGNPNRQALW